MKKISSYKYLLYFPILFILLSQFRNDKISVIAVLILIFIGIAELIAFAREVFQKKSSIADVSEKKINPIEMDELTREFHRNKDEIESLKESVATFTEFYEKEKQKFESLQILHQEIREAYIETLKLFIDFFENKTKFERGHCKAVLDLSCEIGRRMNLSEREIEILMYSSILHDIGKIDFYDQILNKEEELDEMDRMQIKKHPITAYNMLIGVDFLRECAAVILQHHERFDGKGYPYGLEGEKIDKLARIISLADSFEAMISNRAYKKGMDIKSIIEEIEINKGKQFDPEIADILLEVIKDSNSNLEEYIQNDKEKDIGNN